MGVFHRSKGPGGHMRLRPPPVCGRTEPFRSPFDRPRPLPPVVAVELDRFRRRRHEANFQKKKTQVGSGGVGGARTQVCICCLTSPEKPPPPPPTPTSQLLPCLLSLGFNGDPRPHPPSALLLSIPRLKGASVWERNQTEAPQKIT